VKTAAKFDVSEAVAGLDRLNGVKYALARSMAVAGGTALRDEAKVRAPVGRAEEDAAGGGSIYPGALRDAIYLVFRDRESNNQVIKYSVSWNAKKAPHGHLIEFGHWQPFVVVLTKDGWRTLASGKGTKATGQLRPGGPKWIPAEPFLRPAYEAMLPRLRGVMVERGRERLPELLREGSV
jgi:hypothetical protein